MPFTVELVIRQECRPALRPVLQLGRVRTWAQIEGIAKIRSDLVCAVNHDSKCRVDVGRIMLHSRDSQAAAQIRPLQPGTPPRRAAEMPTVSSCQARRGEVNRVIRSMTWEQTGGGGGGGEGGGEGGGSVGDGGVGQEVQEVGKGWWWPCGIQQVGGGGVGDGGGGEGGGIEGGGEGGGNDGGGNGGGDNGGGNGGGEGGGDNGGGNGGGEGGGEGGGGSG